MKLFEAEEKLRDYEDKFALYDQTIFKMEMAHKQLEIKCENLRDEQANNLELLQKIVKENEELSHHLAN